MRTELAISGQIAAEIHELVSPLGRDAAFILEIWAKEEFSPLAYRHLRTGRKTC